MRYIVFHSVIFLLFVSFLASCSLFFESGTDHLKSDLYKINFESKGWETIDPDVADFAFANYKTGQIFTSNSLCKKYQSTPLNELTNNLTSGIQDLKIIKRKNTYFHKRAAQKLHASGKLDGVPVKFSSLTMKKNRCTYDFILISPMKYSNNHLQIFSSILKSISFR